MISAGFRALSCCLGASLDPFIVEPCIGGAAATAEASSAAPKAGANACGERWRTVKTKFGKARICKSFRTNSFVDHSRIGREAGSPEEYLGIGSWPRNDS